MLPVTPVRIGSGCKTLKTFTLRNFGAILSFVDESLLKALYLTEQLVESNVTGTHETSDTSSKQLRVKIRDQDGKVDENIIAYNHPNVIAGTRKYNNRELKKAYHCLSRCKWIAITRKNSTLSWANTATILHRTMEYRNYGTSVKTLGRIDEIGVDGQRLRNLQLRA